MQTGAAKMEDGIKKIDGVTNASVSFMTQKLVIEADDDRFEEIMRKGSGCLRKGRFRLQNPAVKILFQKKRKNAPKEIILFRVFFNCFKGFCTDNMFHAAGIFLGNGFVYAKAVVHWEIREWRSYIFSAQ